MLSLLNTLCYVVFGLAVIALPFLCVNWIRYLRQRKSKIFSEVRSSYGFPVKSTLVFVAAIVLAITTAEIIGSLSRSEVLNYLRGLSGNYIVSIDRRRISDPALIVSALKQMSPVLGHHSHPTSNIQVEIQSANGTLDLELRRDSDNPQEYWVFYPKYLVTSNNEIGRITTPVFDAY